MFGVYVALMKLCLNLFSHIANHFPLTVQIYLLVDMYTLYFISDIDSSMAGMNIYFSCFKSPLLPSLWC